MAHIPVVVFETNTHSSQLIDDILSQVGIAHRSQLVRLMKGAPPSCEYFSAILEECVPKLLLTSWRHIGYSVRTAVNFLSIPRPEVWVVTGDELAALEKQGVLFWADMVIEKPLSVADFERDVVRFLASVREGVTVR